SIYNWIGNVFLMRQNFDRALENYNEGLKHKSKIDSRDQLGEIKLVFGDEARNSPGLSAPNDCSILCTYWYCAYKTKAISRGYRYARKALDIQCKVLGTDHLDVGVTLYNLGVAYDEQKNYDRASQYYLEAVENFPISHAYFKRVQVAMKEIESKTH
ncbi:unnamed protein product, partial [Rotaria magnacalcarata]